jgi:phosphatidylserine decarboxylase
MKLFSRKHILKGHRHLSPLYAVSKRVFNASSATASSAFAKCTTKTTALIKSVKGGNILQAGVAYYSTHTGSGESGRGSTADGPSTENKPPLFSAFSLVYVV